MQLHVTTHLLRVKSLNQHSLICKQCWSTILTGRKTTGISSQIWGQAKLNAQVHQLVCEIDSGAGCNIMTLYIYRSLFRDMRPEASTVIINVYGDSPAKKQGSGTVILLIGNLASEKAVFKVTNSKGYPILCHGQHNI